MYCDQCGAENRSAAKFCRQCQTRLVDGLGSDRGPQTIGLRDEGDQPSRPPGGTLSLLSDGEDR